MLIKITLVSFLKLGGVCAVDGTMGMEKMLGQSV